MSAVLFKLNVGQSGLKETIISRQEVVEVNGVERVKVRTDYTAITLPKNKAAQVQQIAQVEVVEVPVEVVEETVEHQEQPRIKVEVPVFETHQEEDRIYEEYAYEEYEAEDTDAAFDDVDDSANDTCETFDSRSTRIEAAKRNPKLSHKVCMSLNLNPIALEEVMEYAQTDMVKDIKKDVKRAIWNLIK